MFPCTDLNCEAWFYTPSNPIIPLPPIIIMAHGFGAQKDFGLEQFAEGFAKEGYAVFLFDYRGFGGSEGEPRNLVSSTRHLEDWDSAIEYVIQKLHDKIDVNNIALWGSSFSGGHVIVTAAKSAHKDNIKAVITQVPYLSPFTSMGSFLSNGITTVLKVTGHALADLIRTQLGLSRYYLPIAPEKPEDIPLLLSASSKKYLNIIPPNPRGGWKNMAPAQIGIKLLFYSPISFISDLHTPILLIGETNDDLCIIDDQREIAKKNSKVSFIEYDGDHWSVYSEHFPKNLQAQIQFLNSQFKS